MLVNEKPVHAAFLSDSRVPYICFRSITVLCFFRETHGDRCPSKHPVTHNSEIFARRQFSVIFSKNQDDHCSANWDERPSAAPKSVRSPACRGASCDRQS